MKIREGFVSNSSSSSFILAARDKDRLKVTIEVDLHNFVDETISTAEELSNYFEYEYGSDFRTTEPYVYETFKKCLAHLHEGNQLFLGSVCSDEGDNPLSLYFYMHGIPAPKVLFSDAEPIQNYIVVKE